MKQRWIRNHQVYADVGVNTLVGNLKNAADDAMHDAQKHIEDATIKVLKAISIFIFMMLGFIMALVGLGMYLNETVSSLANGLGTIVVGAVLILLGLTIQFFKN